MVKSSSTGKKSSSSSTKKKSSTSHHLSTSLATPHLTALLSTFQTTHLSNLLSTRISLQRIINTINTDVPLSGIAEHTLSNQEQTLWNEVKDKLRKVNEVINGVNDLENVSQYRDIAHTPNPLSSSTSRQKSYSTLKNEIWSTSLTSIQSSINLQSGITPRLSSSQAYTNDTTKFLSSSKGKSVVNSSVMEQVEGILVYERARVDMSSSVDDSESGLQTSYNGLNVPTVLAPFVKKLTGYTDNDDLTIAQREEVYVDASLKYFDDSKLYREMLKDYVTNSSKNASSFQNGMNQTTVLRPSVNKSFAKGGGNTVDRRASKARKLKFSTNTKLVNFCFPKGLVNSKGSGVGEEQWFRSLFGGKRR